MSDWRNAPEKPSESERVERGRAWVAYLKGVLAATKLPQDQRTPTDEDA